MYYFNFLSCADIEVLLVNGRVRGLHQEESSREKLENWWKLCIVAWRRDVRIDPLYFCILVTYSSRLYFYTKKIMKYALSVKLCQHNFTIVIVHKLQVHGHCSDFGLHSPPSRSSRCPNVSSVVAFQGWWVLKSKLFAQESTCSKEILISTSLNHLWFSVVRVIKVDYLDFPCEIF
jgi:hypothetical protein